MRHNAKLMRIDISLLPALAAAFMLVFARIAAMVMLLPGLGESNIPVRIKLAIALLLTLIILPLHRAAYHIDLQSLTPLLVLMLHEIIIGVVLGATARVTLSAPFLVFRLVFNIGLGVLARLMPQMQVYFVGVPLSILAGFLILALVLAAMMGTFLNYFIGVMHDLIPLS